MRRFLIIAASLMLAASFTAGCSTSASSEAEESVKQDWVRDNCRDAATDFLRSPSSAEFSNETVRSTGGYDYSVSGTVDSENGFGAMLRSRYSCSAESSDGDHYDFEAFVLSDD